MYESMFFSLTTDCL